jgi:hypothetical protein
MGTKHIYPTWRTKITEDGKILIDKRQEFDKYALNYSGNENMAIILKPYRKSRSRQEEKYYHAVVKTMVAEAMDIEPEQAHEFLCKMFLTKEEKSKVNGKDMRYKRVMSTTELNDRQYRDFWQRIVKWASLPTQDYGLDQESGLEIYIPEPNEADYEEYM